MNTRDADGLKRMYGLFERVDGLKELLVQFKLSVQVRPFLALIIFTYQER